MDFHTHVFPPEVIARREIYAQRDPTFGQLYGDPKARLATADDLLESMEAARVDVSVILGFAWSDLDDCRRHNDYLLQAAGSSGGRLVPFCISQARAGEPALAEIERCARVGARGVGELRPENQGYGIVRTPEAELLARAAKSFGLVLLFHVSEPTGHEYPGKRGLNLEDFAAFANRHAELSLVGAHWAGGLPFFALMPEVKQLCRMLWFDTAASGLLYQDAVYPQMARIVGPERILFGSDFPLVGQAGAIERVRASGLTEGEAAMVLGENACRLLGPR